MSGPVMAANDIACPECGCEDIRRMISKINDQQSESVIWCANGHIGYLDRHDRYTLCINNHDPQHLWLMVDKRGA
jgi:hypothetical protein